MAYCSKLVVFLLFGFFASASFAGLPAISTFDRFMWDAVGVGVQTVGLSSTGRPVLAQNNPDISLDGGMPKVSVSGSLRNPSGNLLPVNLVSRVPAAEVAKAVGRFLGKSLPLLSTGYALFDLANELGYSLDNSTGAVVVAKFDTSICTVAPCYSYRTHNVLTTAASTEQASAALFKTVVLDPQNLPYGVTPVLTSVVNHVATYEYFNASGQRVGTNSFSIIPYSVAPSVGQSLPSTATEFVDAVAAKSGWPSTSAIARVLVDPLASADAKVKTDPAIVTGPATSAGKVSTTVNSNNTTSTSTTTHHHTYEGANVSTSNVTITNVTNTTTGAVESSSSKSDSPDPVQEPAPDPDLCAKDPSILACQKLVLGSLDPSTVPNVSKPLSINKDTGWGPSTASCPVARTVSVKSLSLEMPWTLFCDFADGIRPMVIGLAWLAAAMTFFGFAKKD